jgi:hypothetical protein
VPKSKTSASKLLMGPGGLRVVLDRNKVVKDDPGADTPAMAYLPFGKGSATFWCAVDTGEVGDVSLTDKQCEWLQEQYNTVNEFLYGA